MRLLMIITIVGLVSCGKAANQKPAQRPAESAPLHLPAKPMASTPVAAQPAMMPLPTDKAQLKRMLAMGYTVHDDHMHAPGVKECPFNMGGSVVQ